MKLRAMVLPLALSAVMLAGCGRTAQPLALPAGAKAQDLRARNASLPFAEAAKQAIATMAKQAEYKNPRLVSIVGRGLDQNGQLVPLLGASWTFRFWADTEDETELVDVIMGVEGTSIVEGASETKEKGRRERVLDPAKLAPPTEVVPFAIRLGLKVARGGPAYSYYDVTYNAFYADPSHADTDVADVVSYYRQDTLDGLHIPATAGLIPAPAPAAKPATPGGKAKRPTKMHQAELEAAKALRDKLPVPAKRQHV